MPPFPRPTGAGFEPYVWAATVADVAARHRLSPAHVLRFDANLPPFAARLAVSPRRALAARGEYPEGSYRELREAAAAYAGCAPDETAVGAGPDAPEHLGHQAARDADGDDGRDGHLHDRGDQHRPDHAD